MRQQTRSDKIALSSTQANMGACYLHCEPSHTNNLDPPDPFGSKRPPAVCDTFGSPFTGGEHKAGVPCVVAR